MICLSAKPRTVLFLCGLLGTEAALVLFVDKPLSLYLRSVGQIHPALIDFFRAYTDIGLGKWYEYPSAALALLGYMIGTTPAVGHRLRTTALHSARCSFFFFCSTALAGVLTNLLKHLIGRARPKLLEQHETYGFHPLSFADNWNSMPSGHSTTAFAVAFAMSSLFPQGKPLWLAFGLLIAMSRVMVNAHYLSDVIAGAGVAWAVNILVLRCFQRRVGLAISAPPSTSNSANMGNSSS